MNDKHIIKLKEKACDYLDHLSVIRAADFNAGQAYAIRLMFKWIEEIKVAEQGIK